MKNRNQGPLSAPWTSRTPETEKTQRKKKSTPAPSAVTSIKNVKIHKYSCTHNCRCKSGMSTIAKTSCCGNISLHLSTTEWLSQAPNLHTWGTSHHRLPHALHQAEKYTQLLSDLHNPSTTWTGQPAMDGKTAVVAVTMRFRGTETPFSSPWKKDLKKEDHSSKKHCHSKGVSCAVVVGKPCVYTCSGRLLALIRLGIWKSSERFVFYWLYFDK